MPDEIKRGTGNEFVADDMVANNFSLVFNKAPFFTLNIQKVNLPGLSVDPNIHPTPYVDRPMPGSKILFEELRVTFVIDDFLNTWGILHDWLNSMDPMRFMGQIEKDKDDHREKTPDSWNFRYYNSIIPEGSLYNDASLIINDAMGIPKVKMNFIDLFPISLSGLNLDTAASSNDQITADATFKYWYYNIEKAPNI